MKIYIGSSSFNEKPNNITKSSFMELDKVDSDNLFNKNKNKHNIMNKHINSNIMNKHININIMNKHININAT